MLKALQSTTQWDDDSIDHLLAAADASGDGQLQVEDRNYTEIWKVLKDMKKYMVHK